jgi:hypothetical protein
MFTALPQPGQQDSPTGDLASVVRTMQVVRAALVMGVFSFGGVVVYLSLSGELAQIPAIPNPLFPNFPLLLLIAAPVAVACVLAGVIVPSVIEGRVRRSLSSKQTSDNEEEKRLLSAHQSATMVRGALVEAPSLLLLITSIAEGHWWGILWAGALQVLQLATFPTTSSVENWLRTQQEMIELERIS